MTNCVVRSSGWGNIWFDPNSTRRCWSHRDETSRYQGFRLIQEAAESSDRMVCGGSWKNESDLVSYDSHFNYPLSCRYIGLSFRLVQED